jgi:hypothetical protein
MCKKLNKSKIRNEPSKKTEIILCDFFVKDKDVNSRQLKA